MKTSESRKKSGASSTIGAPDWRQADGKPRSTSSNPSPFQIDRPEEEAKPTKSRRRVKTEGDVVATELSSRERKSDLEHLTQRQTIKQKEEDIEEKLSHSETKAVPKESKNHGQTVGLSDTSGVAPQNSYQKTVAKVEEVAIGVGEDSPRKTKRKRADIEEDEIVGKASPKKTKRKPKAQLEVEEEELTENGEAVQKTKRKRKTKEEKEAEAMPLAARTNDLRMFIGAHVSCAKGVQNSVTNCVHIGGNAFAMFLKSQRKWENPPLQDEHKTLFISSCKDHKYDAASHVLPHGSYLVNLAQADTEKSTQAYTAFLDDLQRCEALGIKLYNFHPGSTGSHSRPAAIARIAQALNRAHLATKTVIPVLETMANGGNVLGSTFEDLRDIIALIDDKQRVGVCIDTCHVFAAGYDLKAPTAFKKTLEDFDKIVGMRYLRALHLNDSKAPFGSHRDLHQNIGLGFLGLRAFHNVMNEPRFEGLPMVLETPIDHKDEQTGKDVEDKQVWAREIKMLEGLIGMDADGEEFRALEKQLADEGEEERKKLQDQFERKVEKDRKAREKGQTKLQFGKKKKEQNSERGSDNDA